MFVKKQQQCYTHSIDKLLLESVNYNLCKAIDPKRAQTSQTCARTTWLMVTTLPSLMRSSRMQESLRASPTNTTMKQYRYNFHILKDKGLIFVCLAGSRFKLKTAFAFLEEIKKQFRAKYSDEEIQRARDYDMSASFSEIFKNQVNFFNSNQAHDKKDTLMKQLSQLQEVMSENIDKVLQNEQKVELIVKKTAKLDSIADQIKKNASRMKKQAFWKRNKCKLAIGGLISAVAVSCLIIL